MKILNLTKAYFLIFGYKRTRRPGFRVKQNKRYYIVFYSFFIVPDRHKRFHKVGLRITFGRNNRKTNDFFPHGILLCGGRATRL